MGFCILATIAKILSKEIFTILLIDIKNRLFNLINGYSIQQKRRPQQIISFRP